ncbi:MAG: hypothetical protein R2856_12535 [Caldilineaceae bacterium]
MSTCPGLSWVHGTDIGVASSDDGGQSWRYRGILAELGFENGVLVCHRDRPITLDLAPET